MSKILKASVVKRKTFHLLAEFRDEIAGDLRPYPVSIGRVRRGNFRTLQLLGSGTFVKRSGRCGILTADHCLRQCIPVSRFDADETYYLIVRGGYVVPVPGDKIVEHRLGIPMSKKWGPDLTFLEIPPGPQLSALFPVVSFWNMNRSYRKAKRDYIFKGACVVTPGFPEKEQKVVIHKGGADAEHCCIYYFGRPAKAVPVRSGWDYLITRCDFTKAPTLNRTFKGVSGGGIWGIRIAEARDGSLRVSDICLLGVVYYEDIAPKSGRLFGHSARAIYETGWRNSKL